ncbi:branched-chain amino acid ABC transporter permease [Sporichthya polymorpha]|uniref:branched-chain amino acid ABC transporter permease n=1 Tax=Sporichthya polymorpha TaxID=35751 RepID=UPI00037EF672|nr:branched-chain amino acid ABC transporter permease [Sporichthya polymorpha]
MQLDLVPEIVVLGLTVAALYGMLPVAIVLTYRISRTIAFVHGGIAIFGALTYAYLARGPAGTTAEDFGRNDPIVATKLALLLTIGGGAVVGVAFGALVMSRWMAELPGMTLTVVSIAGLLVIGNLSGYYIRPGGLSSTPSPFGDGGTRVGDVVVTHHRLAAFVVLCVLVAALALFLSRTYTGLAIRAIADDVEASVWCGAKLRLIGTGVYGVSGAVAALAGAMYAAAVAEPVDGLLLLMVRGMLIAVVGGLRSLPLALAGAVVYGILETALVVGFFGEVTAGTREITLSGTLLALIVIAARFRRETFFLLERRQA